MTEDIKLKGKHIHGVPCQDKETTLHPKTCASQVMMSHNGSEAYNLLSWITTPYNPLSPDYEMKTSLIEWLHTYYPTGSSTEIPLASETVRGGIKVGNYLTMDTDTEKLSVDIQTLSQSLWQTLPIASQTVLGGIRVNLNNFSIDNIGLLSLKTATTTKLGGVKLGSSETITTFETIETGTPYYSFPIGLNGNDQMGVIIPMSYLDNTKKWLLDYYRGFTYISSAVDEDSNPTGLNINTDHNYILLGNTNVLGQLSVPTMALVAGEGIEFELSTDRILKSDGNHGTFVDDQGNDVPISEIMIKSTASGSSDVVKATHTKLGTIKTATDNPQEEPTICPAQAGGFWGLELTADGVAGVRVPNMADTHAITTFAPPNQSQTHIAITLPGASSPDEDFVRNWVYYNMAQTSFWVNPSDTTTIINPYDTHTIEPPIEESNIEIRTNQTVPSGTDVPASNTTEIICSKGASIRISTYRACGHNFIEIYVLANHGNTGLPPVTQTDFVLLTSQELGAFNLTAQTTGVVTTRATGYYLVPKTLL